MLAVALLVPLLPVGAAADTGDDEPENDEPDVEVPDEGEETDDADFVVTGEAMDEVEDMWSAGDPEGPAPLVLWPEGRRAYQFATSGASSPLSQTSAMDTVVPIDLDTLEPITETVDGEEQRVDSGPLDPPASGAGRSHWTSSAQIPIDHERGTMFVPHIDPLLHDTTEEHAQGARVGGCREGGKATTYTDATEGCLGGIHVLDLEDDALESRSITFYEASTDRVILQPVLWAMSHTSKLGGEEGKLHLLVQETAHWGETNAMGTQPQEDVGTLHWVVQIDVATGDHDWVQQAPGCTGLREQGKTDQDEAGYTIFLGGDDDAPAVYVGCYAQGGQGVVGRLTLDPADPSAPPSASEQFPGPNEVADIKADPDADRIWMKSLAGNAEAWWYFDGGVSGYLGVVGIGSLGTYGPEMRHGTVDPATGRLYVMESLREGEEFRHLDGRLHVTDGRRIPVEQRATHRFDDADLEALFHVTERAEETGEVDYARDERGRRTGELMDDQDASWPIVVEPATEDRPRRLYWHPGEYAMVKDKSERAKRWYVIEDHRPVADELPDPDAIAEEAAGDPPSSDDVELAEGLTRTTYTGTARGYGLRTLMLGGADAVVMPRQFVHQYYRGSLSTFLKQNFALGGPLKERLGPGLAYTDCGPRFREFAFGVTGTLDTVARLDQGGTTGAATPSAVDPGTERDLADPVGRCGKDQLDWLEDLPRTAGEPVRDLGKVDPDVFPSDLGGAERPGVDGAATSEEVGCNAPEFDEDGQRHASSEDSTGDDLPVGRSFTAEVRCEEDLTTDAASRARFVEAGPVSVAESSSDYDLTRDPETGRLQATAHAWARGITIVDEVVGPTGERGTSQVHIDKVEARAESWATGRDQPEDVDAECDPDRTAGTCLHRSIAGVTIVDGLSGETYECGDDCDFNEELAAAMDAALGSNWNVDLRIPDPVLERGTPNGTQAAILKRGVDTAVDAIMKADLINTLPVLEMVRYNDNRRGRGRQVYQFAGVEVATTFTRQCRGVIEGELCVQPEQPLAEVEVTLTDAVDGRPLPDGVFGLHRDDEGTLADGLEALPGERTCTTDAQGQCSFVALEPGAYTLVQAGAPGDYSPTDEQVPLNLSPGSLFEVDVTNVREIGEVEVALTDLDEQPLEGGVFELYADADGDGAIGLDDPQAATCTTDPGGTCTMSGLPLDAYVLRQAAAPEGYAPVEDEVAFALDAPGQVATVGFSNAPAAPPVADDDGGGTGDAVEGGQQAAPQQGSFNGVERTVPMPVHQPVAVQGPLQPQVASDSGSGGPSIIQQMKDAPGEVIRMIRRSPREAAGFAALVLLAGAAVNGPVRRRLLTQTMA